MRILTVSMLLCTASVWPLAAQAPPFDTSGNGKLNGTYYFRHVLYGIDTQADSSGIIGDVNAAIALYGNITFDGNGNYNITNGVVAEAGSGTETLACFVAGSPANCSSNNGVTGTYSISASGFGFIANPIVSGDNIYGLVAANGIFSGSSTESTQAYNDLFIGAPIPSPARTSFNGSYTVAGYLPGADLSFQINPNGSGSLGTVAINGYYEGGGTTTISQSSTVTYTFSNNAAVLTFPTSSTANFFSGQEYLYFSPDGNFFFGGSPTGNDMIVGVSTTSSTQNFEGLYYQAGIDQDLSDLSGGYADFDGYYGSLNATSTGTIVAHERVDDQIFYGSTYGWTLTDSFSPPVTGAYTDQSTQFQYWVSDGGTVRIGQGIGPYLGLTVAFQAPTFTPSGSVYINPTGIVNAASFAPFTAGIANGEFITIFGTNLAPSTVVASGVPYPTKLNNVQVIINNVAAPIYFVSSGQLAVIVPSANPYSLAQIQVINNGVSSNVVTTVLGAPGSAPTNVTAPGVYTNPSGGVYAAAVDTNSGKIVTPSTPAEPGDTVEVFTTGLGTAYPPVADGAAPPTSPLSYTVNTITADVDGNDATVTFAGLAPTLAGLYQVNVTIPSTTAAGDHYLDLSASNPTNTDLEYYTQQVLISVGGGAATAAARPADSARGHRRTAASSVSRTKACFAGAKPSCFAER